ncbi:MAG: sensor histidine kinase [Actinobacteria bacterium]|nr:MAG: sensor histidine kinase [Actinomycetota bacterium]
MATTSLFDLNIEEVLEHWEVEHAIREVIANALDEQTLTGTGDIEIYEQQGSWHVRDFGRGLQIEHFTLNESQEKLQAPQGVIGKFGVGLKDALATFHRRGIDVVIRSAHGTFRLVEASKHDFGGIKTLHVDFDSAPNGLGTDVELQGVTGGKVAAAKAMFLRFAEERCIESTTYGEILERGAEAARVYITGVLANEEPNFLFSYNITDLTPAMRKRLNRERLNVGRTTYTDRVKAILRSAESEQVVEALADQVGARARGAQCDEMQWTEIANRAYTLLSARSRVTFVTEDEIHEAPNVIDHMRRDGYEVVIVSADHRAKLDAQYEAGDYDLRTFQGFVQEYNESFQYEFVAPEALQPAERAVFDRTREILSLIESDEAVALPVQISETMRVGLDTTNGVWDSDLRSIVIARRQLQSFADYAGTLLHEAAHSLTGTIDATRDFECVLTEYLGQVAAAATQPTAHPVSS